jgi:hypothetical protein
MRKTGASSPTSAVRALTMQALTMRALTMRALTMRASRLALVALGLGVGLGVAPITGSARAGDTDDRTISEKIVDGFYGTIRGTNMDNHGIDYRERSPLVVPPKLDLPPPAAAAEGAKIANWPKDPDERQRKAAIAAKKKNAPPPARVQTTAVATAPADPARPVNIAPPPEDPPVPGTTRPAYANDANGTARTDPVYDQPGDLFKGGASAITSSSVGEALGLSTLSDKLGLDGLFGGKKSEAVAVAPGSEPSREALTQPPVGYQTPSPNYPYAVESKGIFGGQSNPDRNPLAQRSSETSVVH